MVALGGVGAYVWGSDAPRLVPVLLLFLDHEKMPMTLLCGGDSATKPRA